MDLLEQWGEMKCQWKEKWIQFLYKDTVVTLHGIPQRQGQELQELSLKQVIELHHSNEIWAMALLAHVSEEKSQQATAPIAELLERFEDIFQEPYALPPFREYDHAIHLQPNASPVNSRPY
jgi:hypothetical protein